MDQYKNLNRAQLSYDYLHTNSTTHEFIFGALAELLDNARDANATKINIYTTSNAHFRGGYLLCFLDDGQGMSNDEACDIIMFGKSSKKSLDCQIGMYGNGLKSGSMRIGNDLILFTKKSNVCTCVFLSRTFHEEEEIDEVIVPMPSFDALNKRPYLKNVKDKEKHQLEMSLILRYSPFQSEQHFLEMFDQIEGPSGTLVVIYNLKLLDNGDSELDTKLCQHDILLTNPESDFDTDKGLMPERKSFRAYTSLLYVDPRMKVYIQGKKVQTKRLSNSLYKPRVYKYSSSRFKHRSESDAKRALEDAKSAENKAREAESKARNLEMKLASSVNRDHRAELRKAQQLASELRKDAMLKKMASDRKTKLLREPKTLMFVFGMNIENRNMDGIFVYNCSRLIKMYQKVGPQADGGVLCSGVVGFVDIPYLVLEPTHNKQDFADAKEYRHLLQAMGEHMLQYWKDLNIADQGVTTFWEGFGYTSSDWKDLPSTDQRFVRKRAMQVPMALQCDLCLKWRILPFSSGNLGKVFPDDWMCNMNPDPSHNKCSAPEERLNMPEGQLRRAIKSKEIKERMLEEEIRKKQEKLDKLNKSKMVKIEEEDEEEEDEEEEDEEEEEEEEEEEGKEIPIRAKKPLVKKKQTAAKKSKKSSKKGKKKRKYVDEDEEEEEEKESDDDDSSFKRPKRSLPNIKPPLRVIPSSKCSKNIIVPSRVTANNNKNNKVASNRSIYNNNKVASNRSIYNKHEADDGKKTTPTPTRPLRSSSNSPATPSPTLAKATTTISAIKDKPPPTNRTSTIATSKASVNTTTDSRPTPATATAVSSVNPSKMTPTTTKSRPATSTVSTLHSTTATPNFTTTTTATIANHNDNTSLFTESTLPNKISQHTDSSVDTQSNKGTLELRAIEEVPLANHTSKTSDQTFEAPSSSSSTPPNMAENVSSGFRECLRYFLPPHWKMTKDMVSKLSSQQLSSFPLDDYLDHYEKGLKMLVATYQTETQNKTAELETCKAKLFSLRKLVAKLLNSINEEFDINPESNPESEQVDELLALCVKQALQGDELDNAEPVTRESVDREPVAREPIAKETVAKETVGNDTHPANMVTTGCSNDVCNDN